MTTGTAGGQTMSAANQFYSLAARASLQSNSFRPHPTIATSLTRIVKALEDLAQGAVDQTFAEIKHWPDCRLCLLRQNPFF